MFLLKIFKIIKVFFLKKFKKGTSQNAVNDFGSCQLSELDYMLKKQTGLYSESGKELDLFGDFLGKCQKVTHRR